MMDIAGLLRPDADCSLCEYGIAHGVGPVSLVLFDVFRRLFHLTASLIRCVCLSVRLDPELRKTHGVVPDAATPERPDPFFAFLCLFHVGTSLRHFVFSLPATLRAEYGEAHRVGPEFPVGLYVLCFFLHDDISFKCISCPGISAPCSCWGSEWGLPMPCPPSRPSG